MKTQLSFLLIVLTAVCVSADPPRFGYTNASNQNNRDRVTNNGPQISRPPGPYGNVNSYSGSQGYDINRNPYSGSQGGYQVNQNPYSQGHGTNINRPQTYGNIGDGYLRPPGAIGISGTQSSNTYGPSRYTYGKPKPSIN